MSNSGIELGMIMCEMAQDPVLMFTIWRREHEYINVHLKEKVQESTIFDMHYSVHRHGKIPGNLTKRFSM